MLVLIYSLIFVIVAIIFMAITLSMVAIEKDSLKIQANIVDVIRVNDIKIPMVKYVYNDKEYTSKLSIYREDIIDTDNAIEVYINPYNPESVCSIAYKEKRVKLEFGIMSILFLYTIVILVLLH